jgi:hypothetical protein
MTIRLAPFVAQIKTEEDGNLLRDLLSRTDMRSSNVRSNHEDGRGGIGMTKDWVESETFLDWLYTWKEALPTLDLKEAVPDPTRVAVVSQDLLKGFCDAGPLASERAASIVPAVVDLFERSYHLGVRHFLLLQDTHDPEAVEFSAYPPHFIDGT